MCCGSWSLCLSITGQRVITFWPCLLVTSGRFHTPKTHIAVTLCKSSARVWNFQKCLLVSCRIQGGTFSPFFLPPLLDPGEGCVIVCVFIFPGTRPAVGWNCVCGAGGEVFLFFRGVGLVLDSLGRRPFAPCRGCPQQSAGAGDRVEVCSPKLLDSLWWTAN